MLNDTHTESYELDIGWYFIYEMIRFIVLNVEFSKRFLRRRAVIRERDVTVRSHLEPQKFLIMI